MKKSLSDNSDIIEEGLPAFLWEHRDGETHTIKNNLIKNSMTINWSKVRTICYFAIVFFIAGLNALKGSIPMDITGVLSILGIVETALYTPEVPTV